eukprot:EG_transcript_23665
MPPSEGWHGPGLATAAMACRVAPGSMPGNTTTVWNSPFSPNASTSGWRCRSCCRNAASKLTPTWTNSLAPSGQLGPTAQRYTSAPEPSSSCSNSSYGTCHSGSSSGRLSNGAGNRRCSQASS